MSAPRKVRAVESLRLEVSAETRAGWRALVANVGAAEGRPTPANEVLRRIAALGVADRARLVETLTKGGAS